MRQPGLSCPHASYGEQMKIRCSRSGGAPCAFQYFKACKGWWALRPNAEDCRLRRKEENYETR